MCYISLYSTPKKVVKYFLSILPFKIYDEEINIFNNITVKNNS